MEQTAEKKALGILDKIENFFKKHDAKLDKETVAYKVEFALSDGTNAVAEGDQLEVGAAVAVQTAEGNVPIADGDHEHENGSIFTTESGKVKTILTPEEIQAAAKQAEEAGTDKDKVIEELRAKNKELEEKVAAAMSAEGELKKSVEALKTGSEEAKKEFAEFKKESIEVIKSLEEVLKAQVDFTKEEPSTKTKTTTKTPSKGELAMHRWQGIQALRQDMKSTRTLKLNRN